MDLIERGLYGDAQGVREGFICDDSYDLPIMRQVWKLRESEAWPQIDRFMGREYACRWLDFKDAQRIPPDGGRLVSQACMTCLFKRESPYWGA